MKLKCSVKSQGNMKPGNCLKFRFVNTVSGRHGLIHTAISKGS